MTAEKRAAGLEMLPPMPRLDKYTATEELRRKAVLDLLNDGVMLDLRKKQKAELERVLDAINEDLREVIGLGGVNAATSTWEESKDHTGNKHSVS
ncbi:unnamed protein product, partial [Amoebophrya sp. A25]|eukprot:GSA25T00012421001.1